MAKSKKQRELDNELLRECQGYTEGEIKPDGAYIKSKKIGQITETFFNINKIKRLIEAGADVNCKGSQGGSPLHCAIDMNYVDLVELLISAGADVNDKAKDGLSPLHLVISDSNISIAIAKLLISSGADLGSRDNIGKTPLHLAVKRGELGLIKYLISAGADVNAKNNDGDSPLYLQLFNIRITHALIKAGADVNAKDIYGDSPLHSMSYYKDNCNKGLGLGTVELLISAGADVNAENLNGETPLLLLYDFEKIRNLLKEHGAVIIKK